MIAALAIAIPVYAATSNATPSPTQLTPANKAGALLCLLLVQDQTKVFAYVAQAEAAGKITADQATAVDNFWTEYHAQFTKAVVLRRLLRAQNESNVKAFLDKAVAKKGSTIRIINEPINGTSVFLVETGESQPLPETRDILKWKISNFYVN